MNISDCLIPIISKEANEHKSVFTNGSNAVKESHSSRLLHPLIISYLIKKIVSGIVRNTGKER